MLDINDGTITAGKGPAIKVTGCQGSMYHPGRCLANDLSKAVRAATLEITLKRV